MSTPAVGSAPYTTIPPCCAHLIADSTDFVFCTDDSIQPTGRVIRIDAFHLGCFIPFETNESHARRTTAHVAYDMQYNVADSTARRSAQAGEQALAVASTALRQSHARQNRATRGGKPTRNGRMHRGFCAENADRGQAETPMRKQNSLKPTLGWCLHQNPCEAVGLLQSRILAHHHLPPPRDSTIGSTVPISAWRHSPTTFGQPLQWQRAPHAPSDAHTMA